MEFPKKIYSYEAQWKSIPHPKREGSNRHRLILRDNEIEVVNVKWDFDEHNVWVIEIFVHADYRRNKIATQIYDCLQVVSKRPIKWTPNAWASDEMRYFVHSYIKNCSMIIAEKEELTKK